MSSSIGQTPTFTCVEIWMKSHLVKVIATLYIYNPPKQITMNDK